MEKETAKIHLTDEHKDAIAALREAVKKIDLSLDKYTDEEIFEGQELLDYVITTLLAAEGLDKEPSITKTFLNPMKFIQDASRVTALIQQSIKSWVEADLGRDW